MLVRIHVPLAINAIPYYEYLQQNYSILCSKETTLEFYVYSMEGSLNVKANKLIQCESSRGSLGHAVALERILQEPIEEDIRILADSDTVMLTKHWDQYLKYIFADYHNYGIIGTTYEPIGGFSSGVSLEQTYKFKPTLTWAAMTQKYDFSKLKLKPNKSELINIDTFEKSLLYNLPLGYRVFCDAAWQVPQYLYDNKIPYVALEHVKPTSNLSKAIKSNLDYNEEFQLWGMPFVGHQRGSNKLVFRQSTESKAFYDAVDKHIVNLI